MRPPAPRRKLARMGAGGEDRMCESRLDFYPGGTRMRRFVFAALLLLLGPVAPLVAQTRVPAELKPDLAQPMDADATAKIRKYTTAPEFNSPLTDYLPASATVPSPSAVLGDVAGAPGILFYTADVNRYFRMLAAASPRVRVISIGTSEEGRERIAVAISSEANLEQQKENDARLAQLADPRLLKLDDARAEGLITSSVPVYYITGTIHSPETGAPTALMELAYRLAVDESPYIRAIRDNVITLITPVVEVDGRDRMVDVYRWHLAHPKANPPLLSYWGHYVAHDNNRDAMGLTLSLSRQVLDTYIAWHAPVLHDLHESEPSETARTWYRQDPPYRTVSWSQRNNNNYEETGLLVSLAFVADNREQLLRGFWEKSKRSIAKPDREGPAAYVLPAADRRPGAQAELLRVLALQHVEISRADRPFTVAKRKFPAGSYVVRMDQPYSRIADALLDRQYWSPDDPQKNPYDDTGWCFPALFDTEAARITDRKVLEAAMSRFEVPDRPQGGVTGDGAVFAVAQRGDDAMFRLRYALGDATVEAAAEPFKAAGHDYPRGTWLVRGIAKDALDRAASEAGVGVDTVAAAPKVATRAIAKPRIALLHTWLNTQTEGWWRQRLDLLKIPYDYISTQDVAADANLGAHWDVILFPPVGVGDPLRIVSGLPIWGQGGEPMPWKTTPETPNLGRIDATDDQRPGLGWTGLQNLRQFVEQGGLLVGVEDTAQLLIATGMAPGVRVA